MRRWCKFESYLQSNIKNCFFLISDQWNSDKLGFFNILVIISGHTTMCVSCTESRRRKENPKRGFLVSHVYAHIFIALMQSSVNLMKDLAKATFGEGDNGKLACSRSAGCSFRAATVQ